MESVARELSHAELLALFQDVPFGFEPGTAFLYNNSGYYLLGMILEEVTGDSYAEHLASSLFEPLGLTRTRYGSSTDIIPNRAQGYRVTEEGQLENDWAIGMSQPGAAGALLSTAGDLVRWQLALVSGQVVSEDSYVEMTAPYLLADMRESAYGFGLMRGELDGRRVVSHGGGIFGFNSYLAHYPDEELSVAVISNSEAYSSQELAERIARLALASHPTGG
jgi:CubicO group peptidase (beta-lactamase class C family)